MENTPKVVEMQVIPVAKRESMLLNLNGTHAPYFARNIVGKSLGFIAKSGSSAIMDVLCAGERVKTKGLIIWILWFLIALSLDYTVHENIKHRHKKENYINKINLLI